MWVDTSIMRELKVTTMFKLVSILVFLSCSCFSWAESLDARRYGAIPDDSKSDTAAIQRAIDECSESGGGTVSLKGGTFVAGSINIKSGVTLKIEKGAVLECSSDRSEFVRGVWILAEDADHVGIIGRGKIVGDGSRCFQIRFDSVLAWLRDGARSGAVTHPVEVRNLAYTHMLQFVNCRDVSLEDIRLEYSQHWTVHLLGCCGAKIQRVRIRNLPYGPYTDGIDIDSSSDVHVVDCDVTAGDDAYCVKTTGKRGVRSPAKNVTFERCIARSPTNGFKIGTETQFDISDVTFRDCKVSAAIPGIGPIGGLTITSVDGANISSIVAERIDMELVRCPIFIRLAGQRQVCVMPARLSEVAGRTYLI